MTKSKKVKKCKPCYAEGKTPNIEDCVACKAKEEQEKATDLNEAKELEYATINLKFGITKDEADAILHNPKGAIARKLRKYMNNLLVYLANKFYEEEPDVTNCKESS